MGCGASQHRDASAGASDSSKALLPPPAEPATPERAEPASVPSDSSAQSSARRVSRTKPFWELKEGERPGKPAAAPEAAPAAQSTEAQSAAAAPEQAAVAMVAEPATAGAPAHAAAPAQ
eukprot:1415446-Prymnesium_polylepis.1